jgi:hypothetical protein
MSWFFPLRECPGIPINFHPGAFGFPRKKGMSRHTGVDLYSVHDAPVYAVEPGVVVSVEPFTGPQDNSPWWLDTDAILVEGESGVICYGEVIPNVQVGDEVRALDKIAFVSTVIPEGKERPDIPGHSRSMLHMELYDRGTKAASTSWKQGREELGMRDPTPHLLNAISRPEVLLLWGAS